MSGDGAGPLNYAQALFQQYDRENRGSLDREQFCAMAAYLNPSDDVDELYNRFSKDEEGALSSQLKNRRQLTTL